MDGSNLDRPRQRGVQDEPASTPQEDLSDSDDEDSPSEESERSLRDYKASQGETREAFLAHSAFAMSAQSNGTKTKRRRRRNRRRGRRRKRRRGKRRGGRGRRRGRRRRGRRGKGRKGRKERRETLGGGREGGGGEGERRKRRRRRRRSPKSKGSKYKPVQRKRPSEDQSTDMTDDASVGEDYDEDSYWRPHYHVGGDLQSASYEPDPLFEGPAESHWSKIGFYGQGPEPIFSDDHAACSHSSHPAYKPSPRRLMLDEDHASGGTYIFHAQGPDTTFLGDIPASSGSSLSYPRYKPFSREYRPTGTLFHTESPEETEVLTRFRHRIHGIQRGLPRPVHVSAASATSPAVDTDNYRSEGIFDHRGGQLTIPSQGLTLFIPPGALPKDTSKKITVEVLRDVPTNIALRDDEMIVTRGFQCHPSGLYFEVGKPVRLRIVHCVDLIDPQKVQTVLFSWSHVSEDGIATGYLERIVQTSRSCWVTPNFIEISLEHFSGGILAFIWNWWYMNGKLMSFMPFLPRAMPSTRRVMLELRMVNKPHEIYWKNVHVVDKNGHYQAAKDDDDVMIIKQEDLQVKLQLEEDPLISKRVSSEILRKTKHTLYFNMDLSNKSDESLVVLNLERSSDQMEIQFMTHFYEHVEFESSSSGKDEIEGSFVRRPSDSASDNNVSESELEMLVGDLGDHEDVGGLALKLGFKYVNWQAYRKMNKDRGFDGTRDMLFDWKKKTPKQEQRSTLRKALEESGFGEAAEIL